jgi:alkanesulfonate monooxygenase SsuD/methylene tetrahydromethanopterin reductase-like flavin-dependent oxidoreductase (luciferase family)
MIGGGGPRMLRFAAREADIVSFVPQSLPEGGLDPAAYGQEHVDARITALEDALTASGRDDGGPERNMLIFAFGDASGAPEMQTVAPDVIASSPYVFPTDRGAMVDKLEAQRERWGVNYVVCFDRDLQHLVPAVKALSGK